MGQVIGYDPCPKCRERGKDSRGDNLVLWSDGGGHCFGCGHHQFPRYYTGVKEKEKENVPKGILPYDFTRDVPTRAWQWLLQYGLGYKYWQEHCGYSESEQRLVFTVGTPTQFSIGRYLGEDLSTGSGIRRDHQARPRGKDSGLQDNPPPEVRKAPRKWHAWGDCHKHAEVCAPKDSQPGGTTVLVEDLISAHKVGQVVECIPLFGTEVHPPHLYALRNGSKRPVVLWLDADQGGTTSKKAMRLQSLVNRPVVVVSTDEDPKCLSLDKIKEVTGL